MTHSDQRPDTIQQLGMSLYAYNFNIVETEAGFKFDSIVFDHTPTSSECINKIISNKYKDGEEMAIQRKGINDSQHPEFLSYNEFAEQTKINVRNDYGEKI